MSDKQIIIFASAGAGHNHPLSNRSPLRELSNILTGGRFFMRKLTSEWLYIQTCGDASHKRVPKQSFIDTLNPSTSNGTSSKKSGKDPIKQYFPSTKVEDENAIVDSIFMSLWQAYFEDPSRKRHCILVFDNDELAKTIRRKINNRINAKKEVKDSYDELPPFTHLEIANNLYTSPCPDIPIEQNPTDMRRKRSRSCPTSSPILGENKADSSDLPKKNKTKKASFWAKFRSLFTPRIIKKSLLSRWWFRRPNWLRSKKSIAQYESIHEKKRITALAKQRAEEARQQKLIEQLIKAKFKKERKENAEREAARKQEEAKVLADKKRHFYSGSPFSLAEIVKAKYYVDRPIVRQLDKQLRPEVEIAIYTDGLCINLAPCLKPRSNTKRSIFSISPTLSKVERLETIRQLASNVIDDKETSPALKKYFILYVYKLHLDYIKDYKQKKATAVINPRRSAIIDTLIEWYKIQICDNSELFQSDEKNDYGKAIESILSQLRTSVKTTTEKHELQEKLQHLTDMLIKSSPRNRRSWICLLPFFRRYRRLKKLKQEYKPLPLTSDKPPMITLKI